MTVLHYQATLSGPIADGIAALSTAETAFSMGVGSVLGAYKACCAVNYSTEFTRLQIVYPTRRPYFQQARPGAGTRPGNCEAPNIAATLNFQASIAGRGRHGGVHFPALSVNDYTGGLVAAGLGGAINGFAAAFVTGLPLGGGNNLTAVIWSRVKPTTPSEILGFSVGGTVRTMHRRTVGLGI